MKAGLALLVLMGGCLTSAFAGGPRYVTGPPFFQTSGKAVGWKQAQLLYFTDSGDLSVSVNHQAADALVAAAAGIWNVPIAGISVARGGALAEHVSGQNVYLDSSGMVWPTDAMVANASAVPIAVVYDADGSVTDTLLGAGASDPHGCEQNGVTETVDAFDPAGYILHAVIVVNGRCTGTAPELQLQLQYQLERVFGRVLGLAWSQTNDNVFTGSPTPSYNQELHWPVMHPIDIRCGLYSYQCMAQPFALRPDDIQAMVSVYPVTGTAPTGKQVSLTDGNTVRGTITFPTGEGMTGVNVLVQRGITFTATPQDWYESSTVTGTSFRRSSLSPFVSADLGASGSEGTAQASQQGAYFFPYMQVQGVYKNDTVLVSTEPVNPLYIGRFSLGPYAPGVVSPGGSAPIPLLQGQVSTGAQVTANFRIADAPSFCGNGADGTLLAPMQEPASGWWTGILCPFGHAAYVVAAVKPGRTFAVEVTALDQNGLATTTKMMPVLGVFAATDSAGSLPSIAVQPLAFNSLAVGTTYIHSAVASSGGVRVGIADERGEGRPDFAYQARFFYADSVSPALVSSDGADVTLTGTGFRVGNQVEVNGVAATVKSWAASTIVVTVPSLSSVGATAGTSVDVTVRDRGTGAVSTMTGVLTYQAAGKPQPNTMLLVAVPGTPASVGVVASGVFSVRIIAGDGVTPVQGATVVFSLGAGAASLGACPAPPCNVSTDLNGLAQTTVTPTAAGLLNLQATSGLLQQNASLTAQVQPLQMRLAASPATAEVVGQASAAPFYVQVYAKGGGGLANDLVTFSVGSGSVGDAVFSLCDAAPCAMVTNSSGQAYMWVTPIAAGTVTLVATDASGLTQQVQITAVDQPMSLKVISASSFTAYAGSLAGTSAIEALAGDGVTTIRGQLITLTGSAGLTLTCSQTVTCNVYTDYFGKVEAGARATLPGTYKITATSGSGSATTTYTFLGKPPSQLSILTYPTGALTLGTPASIPFSVRLVDGLARPILDASVILSVLPGSGIFDCGGPYCNYQTDWNGTVSSSFTPRAGGTLLLNAASSGVSPVTTSVSVAGGVTTLNLIQVPPANVTVGSKVTIVGQLLGADGAAIYLATMLVNTTEGTLANPGCSSALCKYYTGVDGKVTVSGIVWTPGRVSINFTTTRLSQGVTFNVVPNVTNFRLVTGPSGTVQSGTPAIPFVVQVVGADGSTPIGAQNITFSITNGSATLGNCSSLPCVVKTGANGIASTGMISTPAAGPVNLVASLNAMTLSASFNVAAKPDILTLVSSPAKVFQTASGSIPFRVKVTLADGVTPVAGVQVGFGESGLGAVQFGSCGAAACTGVTDANGIVSSPVTGAAVGGVTLLATAQLPTGNQTVTSFLQVNPSLASMRIVSAPSASLISGVAAAAMIVQVSGPDGVMPAAGNTVTFSITNGFGSFASCAAPACPVATDASGLASSGAIATPLAGTVNVTALSGALSASATYTVTPRPDVLSIVQAPAVGLQWTAAVAPLVVRLTLADGVTPVAGVPISLSTSGGGAVVFSLCGSATCTSPTDSNGMVSTTVTAISPGLVILAAAVELSTGSQTVTAVYRIQPGTQGLSALEPAMYVAEGATVATTYDVMAQQNGSAAGTSITWTTTEGIALSQQETHTDSLGRASEAVRVGPLAAGRDASASACAWAAICAIFHATGVSATSFQLGVLAGAGQTVAGGAAYAPVVLEITDSAGHPVSGAALTVGQTVTAITSDCPVQGRCPAAAVLASEVMVVATDLSGQVTIQPLQANGPQASPSRTDLQCSSGLYGATNIVLHTSP